MKKLLFISASFLFPLLTFAQKGLYVGILGGPQSVWLINKNDSDDPHKRYRNDWRGFVGGTVGYNFSPTAGVGLEFLYSMQGQNYLVGPGPTINDVYPYSNRVNYFKLPLLLNFSSIPQNVVMFVGKVGPVFGFTTSANVSNSNAGGTGANPPFDQPDGTNLKGVFQSATVGMLLGLGFAVNIKQMVLIGAGIRLDATLTDPLINLDANTPAPENTYFSFYDGATKSYDTVRSRTWALAGGIEISAKYIIPVGKKSHSNYNRK